jgi:hypothetical protein
MLPHDSQGFLIGEVIPEIRRAAELLRRIRADVADIKRAFLSPAARAGSGPQVPPPANRQHARDTALPRPRGSTSPGSGQQAQGPGGSPSPTLPPLNGETAGPGRRRHSRAGSRDSEEHNRDDRGRFTNNNENPDEEERKQKRLFSGMADRIADAVTGSATGLEDIDPTIKAINEVAQPLARGYQLLAGGDKETRWYRRLFGELRLFRKEQTVFNRAEQRVLREIDENTENTGDGGSGGSSFFGGLLGSIAPFIMAGLTSIGGMIVAALSGVGGMIVAGATALLGAIFSPIGLAIGAAATAAWGLFTEDGRKFFANVADKLYMGWYQTTEYLKGKWDAGVKAFNDLWAPIGKFFADKFGIVSESAKAVVDKVADTANKANDFVKDQTGVDVKEKAKAASATVKTAYQKTVEAASRNVIEPAADFVKSGAASAKAVPKRLQARWQEAKQFLGEAAVKAGVDPGILAKIANFESGFNAEARPVRKRDGKVLSSAHGYGQFLDATWTEMVNKHGGKYGVANAGQLSATEAGKLRSDKALQASLLAEFTRENLEKGRALGGANDDANVYALHNLGEGDGAKFLQALKQKPKARVSDILSQKVIAGNQSLYGNGNISLERAYQNMAAAMRRGETFAKEIRMPTVETAQVQSVSAPSPSLPAMPKPPVIAEAPKVMMPLTGESRKSISINIDRDDIGQDISDRRLAHIVTGGLSS